MITIPEPPLPEAPYVNPPLGSLSPPPPPPPVFSNPLSPR